MKRRLSCAILLFVVMAIFAVSPESSSDVIVLLDTSSSMVPYFDLVTDNILCGITRNYIRLGDTFHLISFGSTYKLETAQTIQTKKDVESVVSRFMLLYPLDTNTDFVSALKYTNQYVSTLRVESKKSIIVISDGIQDPATGSTTANLSPADIQREISITAAKMKTAGWNIYYIKLPFPAGSAITESQNSAATTIAYDDTATTNTVSTVNNHQRQSSGNAENNSDTDSTPTIGTVTNKNNDSSSSWNSGSQPTTETIDTKNLTNTADSNSDNTIAYNASDDFTQAAAIAAVDVNKMNGNPEEAIQTIFNLPIIEIPADIGKRGYSFKLPLSVTNTANRKAYLELNKIFLNDKNILDGNAFIILDSGESDSFNPHVTIPNTIAEGSQHMVIVLEFAENQRTSPQELSFTVNLQKSFIAGVLSGSMPIFIPILMIFVALFLIILLAVWVIRSFASHSAGISDTASKQSIIRPSKKAHTQMISPHNASVTNSTATLVEKSSDTVFATQFSSAAMQTSSIETGSSSIPNQKLGKTPNIQYTNPDTSSYKKEDVSYSKPQYGAIDLQYSKENTYDAEKMRQAVANQKNSFSYTLKRDTEYTKSTAIQFEAADPNAKIEIRSQKNTMLELYVYNQSRMIGKRNIHRIKPGCRYSIGGGNSGFLVFLVKFPQKIAELRYDGESCSLAILKPQYFPNETSAIIENCIGREFCIISDKGYPVIFKFREYEDPVEYYNRLINSIKYD